MNDHHESNEKKSLNNMTGLAIGGGCMLGLGAGFFFFPISVFGVTSVFAFIGCIMGGLGLGLTLAALLSARALHH